MELSQRAFRVGELAALKWCDVVDNSIKIRRAEIFYIKVVTRKTYVSILLDNGVDKRLVQDVAGHTQISTSERNYHRKRKSNAKKEEILSNLPEFKNVKVMF